MRYILPLQFHMVHTSTPFYLTSGGCKPWHYLQIEIDIGEAVKYLYIYPPGEEEKIATKNMNEQERRHA